MPLAINPGAITTFETPPMRAPVFIIGYPRSGTSFVGKLIAQFTEYRMHGESHTLTLLQELHHQINLYRRRTDFTGRELVKHLDLVKLKELNTAYFRDFYMKTYGSERFIDKTPGAVACHGWGVVKDAFPSAAFVACIRSPVEVCESALKKFKGVELKEEITNPVGVARGWVSAMKGIEKLSASQFKDDLHLVSQLELRTQPLAASHKLADFIGVDHSSLQACEDLCKQSRDDVLTDSIHLSSYKPLKILNLSKQEEEEFYNICYSTCLKWGIQI